MKTKILFLFLAIVFVGWAAPAFPDDRSVTVKPKRGAETAALQG